MKDGSIDYTGIDYSELRREYKKALSENEGLDPAKAAKIAQLNIQKAEVDKKMAPLIKQKADIEAKIAALSK